MVCPCSGEDDRLALCSTLSWRRWIQQFLYSSTKLGLWKLGSKVIPFCRTLPTPLTLTSSVTSIYHFTSPTMLSWRKNTSGLLSSFFTKRRRKYAFEADLEDAFALNTIWSHGVEVVDGQDRWKCHARFATTQRFAMKIMINSWLCRFRCFFGFLSGAVLCSYWIKYVDERTSLLPYIW